MQKPADSLSLPTIILRKWLAKLLAPPVSLNLSLQMPPIFAAWKTFGYFGILIAGVMQLASRIRGTLSSICLSKALLLVWNTYSGVLTVAPSVGASSLTAIRS